MKTEKILKADMNNAKAKNKTKGAKESEAI